MWLNKLKDMKKQSGKTSKQIAEETGIPKSTIDKLFSGQTKEPYISSTKLIVNCLGYTLDDLFNNSNTVNQFECNKHEQTLVIAYRQHPEMQKAVDKLLDLINVVPNVITTHSNNEMVAVPTAARSAENRPVEITYISKEKLEQLENSKSVENEVDI